MEPTQLSLIDRASPYLRGESSLRNIKTRRWIISRNTISVEILLGSTNQENHVYGVYSTGEVREAYKMLAGISEVKWCHRRISHTHMWELNIKNILWNGVILD
jgi:hypothetical protein